jgi:hypothetical protein
MAMKSTANSRITTNFLLFKNAFFDQKAIVGFDNKYRAILNILLFYIWQGINKTRNIMLQGKVEMNLGTLCIAVFISFLPILQNLRLGFPSDTIILLRALLERIALLGYLEANPHFLAKYTAQHQKFLNDAMSWAKKHSPENWMKLYSLLSKVAHPSIFGTSGYILSKNLFSESFRLSMPPTEVDKEGIDAEIMSGIYYGLSAVDPIAEKIVGPEYLPLLQPNPEILKHISLSDLREFSAFAKKLINSVTSQGQFK